MVFQESQSLVQLFRGQLGDIRSPVDCFGNRACHVAKCQTAVYLHLGR